MKPYAQFKIQRVSRMILWGAAGRAMLVLMALATFNTFAATAIVSNNHDSGPGSLRAAVAAANDDSSITTIQFQNGVGTIVAESTITYSGPQSLTIIAQGAILDGASEPFDLLIDGGGGNLTLQHLVVQNSGANGIVVAVPSDAVGEVTVALFDVGILDNALFGLHIDDLAGSAAGVGLTVDACSILRNGQAETDKDGIRIDERGEGGIWASVNNSEVEHNGGDGIELDEGGPGDAALAATHSSFSLNGFQDPDDFDDGIDIDEADEGDVLWSMVDVVVNGNADQGCDIDEDKDTPEGAGNLIVQLVQVDASGNTKEGIKCDEEGPGNLDLQLNLGLVDGSAKQEGIDVSEADAGNLSVRVVNSVITNNKKAGLAMEQADDGTGSLRLQHVTFSGNDTPYDTDGVSVIAVGGNQP
jgi:hypothetical protein